MTGVRVIRIILGVIGALLLLAGLGLAFGGGGFGPAFVALWLIVAGGLLVIVAVIEVGRYRSEAAEQAREQPGPGGGEPGRPESRFQRTEEAFIDPTTRHSMRVYVDPLTGERRYVPED